MRRISAPNDIGSTFVARLVAAFTERYPHVDVSVELGMRQVNLVHEGFDVALRASEKLSDSSLVARKAGDLEAALYASPAYLNSWGAPTEPQLIAAHDAAAGRLVRVLPQFVVRGAALYVVYAAARVLPAKIAAFRDFVLQSCSQAPVGALTRPSVARSSRRGRVGQR